MTLKKNAVRLREKTVTGPKIQISVEHNCVSTGSCDAMRKMETIERDGIIFHGIFSFRRKFARINWREQPYLADIVTGTLYDAHTGHALTGDGRLT